MTKKNKVIILTVAILAIITALIMSTLYKKGDIFYEKTKTEYISFCKEALSVSTPGVSDRLDSICECSHNKFSYIMGKEKMIEFVKIINKRESSLTDKFFKDNNINIQKIDTSFISCIEDF